MIEHTRETDRFSGLSSLYAPFPILRGSRNFRMGVSFHLGTLRKPPDSHRPTVGWGTQKDDSAQGVVQLWLFCYLETDSWINYNGSDLTCLSLSRYSPVCILSNPQLLFRHFILDFGKKQDDIPIKNGKIDHSQKKLENKCCLITFIIFLLLFVIFFFYSVAMQNLSQWSTPVDHTFAFTFPSIIIVCQWRTMRWIR